MCVFPFPGKFFFWPCVPRLFFYIHGLCVCSYRKIKRENYPQSTILRHWMSSNIKRNCIKFSFFLFFLIISYLLLLWRGSSSLFSFRGKIFLTASMRPQSKSMTSFLDRRQMWVWYTVITDKSFSVFLSLSAIDECLTALNSLNTKLIGQIKPSGIDKLL